MQRVDLVETQTAEAQTTSREGGRKVLRMQKKKKKTHYITYYVEQLWKRKISCNKQNPE